MDKLSYIQGTKEPKKDKEENKSNNNINYSSRFKNPFYSNYDLYDVDKSGPGGGFYQNMQEYKSVQDFLKKKRKRMRNKYVADISEKRSQRRLALLKLAIDFQSDQLKSLPILGNEDSYINSVQTGGQSDYYLSLPDFEGKLVTDLNIGRDYSENENSITIDETINPQESDLIGFPSEIEQEDLDADKTISNKNPYAGTTNLGNNTYDKILY